MKMGEMVNEIVETRDEGVDTAIEPRIRMLIINPNTSKNMSDALIPAVEALQYSNVDYTYFTSPEPGIPSINSPKDAEESAHICLPHLVPLLPDHDAFLVACYSQHPLVPQLKLEIEKLAIASGNPESSRKYVTGIFESSVTASLALVGSSVNRGFGIVSTGKVWEDALQAAVHDFVGSPERNERFLGCETTGLNASELHNLPTEVVRAKMMEATKRLVGKGVSKEIDIRAICLGCAGMVGLEEAVRQACIDELGSTVGQMVSIVDGVKAGVGLLVGLAKGGF